MSITALKEFKQIIMALAHKIGIEMNPNWKITSDLHGLYKNILEFQGLKTVWV